MNRRNVCAPDPEAARQWSAVQARLKKDLGEATYNSWVRPLAFNGLADRRAVIVAPTRFMRDWVSSHYAERILGFWRDENSAVQEVTLGVRERQGAAPDKAAGKTARVNATPAAAKTAQQAPAAQARSGDDPDEIGAPFDARLSFDNFVVGKSNELAHAAARRVAEAKTVPFNPLYLYGGVGLGKTHLMHAIGLQLRESAPEKRVFYLSAEKFMYRFIRALRYKDTMTFKEQFRSVDVLMIDDVQFIAGKDSTQEEFFHTFNALVDQNRQIIISGDRSPTDLEGIEERMRSRLGWGLVADIHPTDYELRLGILQSKQEQMRAEAVPPKVLEFLARKIVSNVRELEGALNRVVAYSDLTKRPITLESTQEVLRDLLRANDRRVTIEEIQKRVAEHYNIRLAEMQSARRARAVARPRQVAMYLAKQLTSRSLPEIGRQFGGRDHTTVMHALRKIEELRGLDATIAEDLELLRRMLEN
ncbi:chromosomal replication initiator protein DnaA [Oceanibacterium hippocampi]|uniref:Chromosomal replication initiator protein DnaA n=1 Tax=Oceanibacterium hippocampi TaxID=745714 RepID=A0A1Y5RSF4_9PROT|nr:chromosomal replication initiator protein DnaA [Oceanibacterium hippocampi]SLN21638.1 Chromosomal replication initiator protein DnaA [Oceanibacterium hippocampi]